MNLVLPFEPQYRLPAVYFNRYFATSDGPFSYGADYVDQPRRAASYVDRILKARSQPTFQYRGPTKYILSINLKTAKALSLTVPPT